MKYGYRPTRHEHCLGHGNGTKSRQSAWRLTKEKKMGNEHLKFVFNIIFDRDFNYERFTDRLLMQKTVYLLQCLGVPIGEYSFSWYKHGPYSQELQDDMYYENRHKTSEDLSISEEDRSIINKLKDLFDIEKLKGYSVSTEDKYDSEKWVECLASLHFLRTNILPYRLKNNEDFLNELREIKPHLCNEKINMLAIRELEKIFKYA